MSENGFGLKQKFNIKCIIDIIAFAVSCIIFMIFAKIKQIAPYDAFMFLFVIFAINGIIFILSRQWILRVIKGSLFVHSETITNAASDISNSIDKQLKIFETFEDNASNINELTIKLQSLAESFLTASKNTEKQINQSIAFSQKEHDAISSSSDKMIVLRQKIQMIAELILELSEHTQQIGNSIGIVDDIAEQTNMLALNAAVEAARAGEHGKGFAVVAGEIRKLADESKQAITKITSLTNSIQYTTNSTVMATEEGSKEIESVVKDITQVFSDSELLLNLVKEVLESINIIATDAKKYSDIIEKLKDVYDQNSKITVDLQKYLQSNAEKITKLHSLSEEIKTSATEA